MTLLWILCGLAVYVSACGFFWALVHVGSRPAPQPPRMRLLK